MDTRTYVVGAVAAAAVSGAVLGLCLGRASTSKPQKPVLPKIIFGTASLGNLYAEPPYEDKKAVVEAVVKSAGDGVAVFDSAGKYGAGLALEVIGQALDELGVPPEKVLISNKLAWKRIPLPPGTEPTFEPGAWVNLKNDAVQDISYQGILDCFENGNELLGKYKSGLGSVHDPDEYLAAATSPAELEKRRSDVLGAYKALSELRDAGKVASIGVGAKDITAIDWISDHVQLDWAMFACSITPYSHSDVAKRLLTKLGKQGVDVINSAVFNGGFLTGGSFFDYREVKPDTDPELFAWRDKFNAICAEFNVKPAAVCVQFSFLFPEIKSVALATSKPARVASNIELANAVIPSGLWKKLEAEGLINLSQPV
eukprot:COSAG02_NODE_42_length_46522_cov_109.704478_6_plen_370_part_00